MDRIDRIDRRLYGSGVAEPAEGADLLGEGDENPRLTSVVSIYMNTTYGRPNL